VVDKADGRSIGAGETPSRKEASPALTGRRGTNSQPALVWGALTLKLSPNLSGLPGGSVLQKLADGISGWALLLALIGLLVGAAVWALGSHSQNYHHSVAGRRAVLVSALAALVIGAAPALVNFFFSAGQSVH
jgi:hypothetical protein